MLIVVTIDLSSEIRKRRKREPVNVPAGVVLVVGQGPRSVVKVRCASAKSAQLPAATGSIVNSPQDFNLRSKKRRSMGFRANVRALR
jgi:hypothetical protein